MDAMLRDAHGRSFPYLRLSLIEACNFRCRYCLPDGYRARPGQPPPLQRDELRRLLAAFAELGMRKLRFTGGEPSLRRDLPELIALAAATPGVGSVALTTNGTRLSERVPVWRRAGLTHLNVSVDALDPARFAEVTGRDRLDEVLAGVEAALALDFAAVKLNAVLLRGLTDGGLAGWLGYLGTRRLTLRFIELMRTGDNQDFFEAHHLRAKTLEDELVASGWRLLPRAADAGPAREYFHPDSLGRIGIIAPYGRDFCAGCNRLRVTANGELRLCLFGRHGHPLRPLLQHDEQLPELVATIRAALAGKEAGHRLNAGDSGQTRNLATIGG